MRNLYKRLLLLSLLVLAFPIICLFGANTVSADSSHIYVNTNGNDNYNGQSPV